MTVRHFLRPHLQSEAKAFLDSLLRGLAVLGFIAALLILTRAFVYKIWTLDVIEMAFVPLYILLVYHRRRIDPAVLILLSILSLWLVGFTGIYFWGLVSQGPMLVVIALMVSAVYYGRIGVLALSVFSTGVYAFMAALHIKGFRSGGVDILAYSRSPLAWLLELLSFAAGAGYVAYLLAGTSKSMHQNYDILRRKSIELEEEDRNREKILEMQEGTFREKNALLEEVHHRVKNNLHVISTLMQYQTLSVKDDKESFDLLTDTRLRINSFSILYKEILHGQGTPNVHFSRYAQQVAISLAAAWNLPVRVETSTDDSTIGLDTALPCGLVAFEVLSAMMKQARNAKSAEDVIRIKFFKGTAGLFEFGISYDRARTEAAWERYAPGPGINTIEQLCRSLSADFQFSSAEGWRFSMVFREYFEAGSILY